MGASTHESSGGIHAHGQLKLKKALPAQNVQQLNNKGRMMVPSTVLSPVVVPASVPNNKTQNDGLLRVSTFWETLHLEEKRLLLRMPLEQAYRTLLISSQLESHATEMNNVTQVKYDKMIKRLHESLDRMESHGTWKMWKCTLNEDLESPPIFHTSEELRNHLTTNHNLNLQPVKPGRPPTPAETALRERMANLLETVADDARQVEEVIKTRDRQRRIPQKKLTEWARQRTITKICTILDHMHHEEQCLFDSCLLPVLRFVNDNIPDGVERQSTSTQIVYADLKLLSTNSLERCEEYLLDRVEGYAAELNKPRDPNDGVRHRGTRGSRRCAPH